MNVLHKIKEKETELNLIPSEILNLIWNLIDPIYKYILSKEYFMLYYNYKFIYINNRYIRFYKSICICESTLITNYNYIRYMIINNNIFVLKYIISNKIDYNNISICKNLNNKIVYKDKIYNNFFDFCYYYARKHKASKIINYIESVIKQYKLSNIIYKQHKNIYKNNKNRNNTNKWII